MTHHPQTGSLTHAASGPSTHSSARPTITPRSLADQAADAARLAQVEHQVALAAARQAQAGPATYRRGMETRYAAGLAEDRATRAMQVWAEAELQAHQASVDDRARAADVRASSDRVRNARNAALARWRKQPSD